MVEGDIFKKHQEKDSQLNCISKSGKKLKLGSSCAGQFSTDPDHVM